ncbi:hypothetical protein BHC48_08990 [Snodgrassella communis]|uniref:Uncharacterized protein n=1 Tax=Snodgrassella alvi TaxID=1196083 RepID=A0A2N9XKZ2_9NEIS|nr:hypothetical protein BHC48_08990 [Snodgrassella communis]
MVIEKAGWACLEFMCRHCGSLLCYFLIHKAVTRKYSAHFFGAISRNLTLHVLSRFSQTRLNSKVYIIIQLFKYVRHRPQTYFSQRFFSLNQLQ